MKNKNKLVKMCQFEKRIFVLVFLQLLITAMLSAFSNRLRKSLRFCSEIMAI